MTRLENKPPSATAPLAAVDLITGPGFTMMRKQEPSVWTVILVMINLPVGTGMILQIGMERRNLRHLLLLRMCVSVSILRAIAA
jgi:hypothetical protein